MYAYLAFDGLEKELIHDLKGNFMRSDRFFLSEEFTHTPWAQIILSDVQRVPVESIGKAAKFLKEQNKFWKPYSFHLHRRTELIQQQLPKSSSMLLDFLKPPPQINWGHWVLENENSILYSLSSNHALPWGEVHINEDKEAPSRAYTKLWEGLTLHGPAPQKDDVVVDMGSSPGGWTYLLNQIGCTIYSIDRSPLREDLMKRKNIDHRIADVFKVKPQDLPDLDWFFSDVICYPEKALEWVKTWLDHPRCRHFFVTIKFQGETDFKVIERFKEIQGSRVIHLFNNKHELTWIYHR